MLVGNDFGWAKCISGNNGNLMVKCFKYYYTEWFVVRWKQQGINGCKELVFVIDPSDEGYLLS